MFYLSILDSEEKDNSFHCMGHLSKLQLLTRDITPLILYAICLIIEGQFLRLNNHLIKERKYYQ
jgi:hypothetical protein